MDSVFIHPQAIVESRKIGAKTRVWAFTHVLAGAAVGEDCNICDHVFIENDVVVGDRVTIKSGVQLWDGVRLEDDVFIGPNATFTNDPLPRSKHHLERYPETVVENGASLGANCTILPGLNIGRGAMVAAGAVVTRSVPPGAIVSGVPASISSYADTHRVEMETAVTAQSQVIVNGVRLIPVPVVQDLRGNLVARESGDSIPFVPQRIFVVFDVPSKEVRGEHAHRNCQQLLVCLKGSVSVVCDDGKNRQEVVLDNPGLGLLVPPLVWAVQYKYSADAVLQVLASHPYDPGDYIRDYTEFRQLVGSLD